jgi:2-polyprenyl-3-methyl-5-hydroxy-6-metoxy-1,4-benzoquinol methylase
MRVVHGINPERVLETGSLDKKYRHGARVCFPDAKEFIGIDIRSGVNVDMVLDIYDIYDWFGSDSFDVVLCLHVLEHLPRPWEAVDKISSVLSEKGYLFVSVPTLGYPRHNYPGDYWRPTHEALTEVIMKDYDILDINDDRSEISKHPFINCLGRKKV